ncbi:MAG: hypothetical protein CSA68_03015 [Rhodobacterales bacterium]|nr:MAG: hypothetical protein CSA68_03015 [Rhodobacterales bacterium]
MRMLLHGLILTLALLALPQIALAEAAPEKRVREIHVLISDEGDTRLIMRFPLRLAYANELAKTPANTPLNAPFIVNHDKDGQITHHLNSTALLDDYGAFGDFLLRDYRFSVNGRIITPDTPEYVVVEAEDLDNADINVGLGLTASASMLSLCAAQYPDDPNIDDTLIVISLFLGGVMPDDPVKIELLSTALPGAQQAGFETRIMDYRGDRLLQTSFKGNTFAPLVLKPAPAGLFASWHVYAVGLIVVVGLGLVLWRRRLS